ncbi:MAG: hypothetical protein JXB47_01360 [Anaerolineae bacterium]|nr:hypothetical protein [Anaerolineae bacterium]
MKTRNLLLVLGFLSLAALGCNLTQYRPTPPPPTVGAGEWVNPYLRAALANATAAQVQALDPNAPGAYTPMGTLTGAALEKLMTALNVSVQTQARDPNCPDHLRMIFIWPDASQRMLSACLDGAVILRGVPGAENLDIPMYGAASDALAPYLPAALQERLSF